MSDRFSEAEPQGPVVDPLPTGAAPDPHGALDGRTVMLVPVEVTAHASDLYESFATSDPKGMIWQYMSYGPFESEAAFRDWLLGREISDDPLFYAIIDKATGKAHGMMSYLRAEPAHGVIEIGHIWFSPALQRTRQATEAIYLTMTHAFDALNYRRLEWKCNANNDASRRAAGRFGFTFEGVFRQHMVLKGRNRDTAWYAILDCEWPHLKKAYESWLDDANFDADGTQRKSLSDLVSAAREQFPGPDDR